MRGYMDPKTNRPMMRLNVNGKEIECLIDTGFNGSLATTSDIGEHLELACEPYVHHSLLANGETAKYRRAICTLEWFNTKLNVQAQVFLRSKRGSADVVIGTRLLTPYIIVIDFNHGVVTLRDPAAFAALS